jgi:DNA-binding Lrp family transcriptional regulator
VKDVELKLIIELLKNSRRSDRELARKLGVSQPTITRIRSRLEKDGTIREYTMIPDYVKLDFQLMSVTFAKLNESMSKKALENMRKTAREMMEKHPTASIIAMNGIGLNADRVMIAFHTNYSEYTEYIRLMKQYPPVVIDELKSFIVDLLDKTQFRPLTFSALANYLLRMNEDSKC